MTRGGDDTASPSGRTERDASGGGGGGGGGGLGAIVGAQISVDDADDDPSRRRATSSNDIASAPTRTIHQAMCFRPEDARGGKDPGGGKRDSKHHGGRHQNYMAYKIEKLGEQNDARRRRGRGQSDARDDGTDGTDGTNGTDGEEDDLTEGVFHGVSVYVNGLTEPPWMTIKDVVLAGGGGFANYYSRAACTHVVCANLTDSKLDKLRRADGKQPPIVKPAWITDSVREGRLMPCAAYALERSVDVGQRRMTSVLGRAAAAAAPAPAADVDVETLPAAADEILPTQDDDDADDVEIAATVEGEARSDAAAMKATTSGEDVVRVAFDTVVEKMRALPIGVGGGVGGVGDPSAVAAAAAAAAVKVASAAAYAALTTTVAPARIAPVSASEALVDWRGERVDDEGRRFDAAAAATAIATALASADVKASVSIARVHRDHGGGGGTSALRVDIIDDVFVAAAAASHREPRSRDAAAPALKSSLKTSTSSAKRVRFTVAADSPSPPRRRRAAAPPLDGPGPGPGPGPGDAGGSIPTPLRRSSFAASAAAAAAGEFDEDAVDRDAWDALPLRLRAELKAGGRSPPLPSRLRPRAAAASASASATTTRRLTFRAAPAPADACSGESPGGGEASRFDAFGSLLGIKRAARRPSPPPPPPTKTTTAAVAPTPDATVSARTRAAARRASVAGVRADGLPASFSQIDRDFLDAIGPEERRELEAHYAREEQRARAARETGLGRGGERKGGRGRGRGRHATRHDARQRGLRGFDGYGVERFEPAAPPPPTTTTALPLPVVDLHDGEGEGEGDDVGSAEDVVVALETDEEIEAFLESLRARVSRVAEEEGATPSAGSDFPSPPTAPPLDAAAELLCEQAMALARAHNLEGVKTVLKRAFRFASGRPERWRELMTTVAACAQAVVEEEYDGCVLGGVEAPEERE